MGKLVAFLWCYRVFQFYDGKDIITWEHGFILPVYCAAGLSVTFYIWESGLHCPYCSHRHGQRIDLFFFYLSLHITQTVVSAWQETPVLQKFQANSTTNKVFTAYPFLQNRQESRLKVLTVCCLFLLHHVPHSHRCSTANVMKPHCAVKYWQIVFSS